MRKQIIAIFLLLSLLLAGCIDIVYEYEPTTIAVSEPTDGSLLQVHFIDVGQADCVLIQQGDHSMLIDAGNNEDGDAILRYLRSAGVSKLDYAVGTHPHEDHIGALDTVLQNISTESLLMPRIQTNTKTFEDVLDAAIEQNLSITAPKAGDTFPLGEATLTAVNNYTGEDLNDSSIILRLTYGETAFLFTGDAEVPAEEAAMQTGLPLRSDVLKVGHHGSSTSTSAAFLSAVDPTYAVIPCGVDNDYGHPHAETMETLNNAGCEIFRTDEQGTIVALSDGTSITWNTGSVSSQETVDDTTYVLNTSSQKFHLPTCSGVQTMSEKNKTVTNETRQQLLDRGYEPCGSCDP